ncbi:M28 family peptidase [Actinoalloteichus hymeniacidonis]|uniref:PA domain-containing protein n=1 Tax=Actinoalloteichus hymeniacidonis TaxID=340345 RepID=A0AAC9HS70_9PSEU|nr:M28 family peptidase [Actinoalloteichus hymeniacidonis]AOS64374.1 PA domain-containing protein [Actinoalloteichus hymeniacidonis]MBB5907558.1 aminopeptidase YwaD [Actinoalloteichus hymeniacidonis]
MSGVKRRDLIGGAAALAAFVMAGAASPAFGASRIRPGAGTAPNLGVGDRAVAASVDGRRALGHIQHLAETIGPRIGGTESEHRAADYAAARFEALGYQVTRQPFPVADKYLADLVLPDGQRWQASASPQGAFDTEVEAAVADIGSGIAPDDPAGSALEGQFALIDHRTADRETQVRAAAERGAVGVLLVASSATPDRKAGAFLPTLATPVGIPVLGLGQAHGEWLRRRLMAGPVRLRVVVTRHTNLTSYNVLAERPASIPSGDQVVMIGAHYDSVPGSPGANDDASGSALCLELARVLRSLPTQKALRFALWGSEEQGLIGSRYYVDQLDDHAAGRISACFQNDMVATSHPPADLYWLLSVDGADNLATATVAEAATRLGYLADVAGPTARGGSDHVPFHERGIPAANFSWRGEAGPHLLEPVYHTPEDTVAGNVSTQRLQVSLELVGSAVYEVARSR